jgi:flagellin
VISVTFGNMGSTATMASLNGFNLSTPTVGSAVAAASQVITAADVAIEAISTQRATFGAVSNRLTHTIDNLTNVITQSEASRSRIMDTDYAQSTSELARTQIIQQAGTAMLAQANQLPQTVLALLQ